MHLTDTEAAELERNGFLPAAAALVPAAPKPSKYHNQKTVIGDFTFASKREANRYLELKLMELAGAISKLTFQPVFVLEVKGVVIGKYIGDSSYYDLTSCKLVVEDVKGVKTAVYRLKKKLVEALYGIEIHEV